MKYKVTIEFTGPEDLSWFCGATEKHREYVKTGSQLEGGGRSILMAALGRAKSVKSTMTSDTMKSQRLGTVGRGKDRMESEAA